MGLIASAGSNAQQHTTERDMAASIDSSAEEFAVIAHRGGAGYAPENTLPAFRRSSELGFAQVELDVRRSGDGVLMLFHDGDLEPKTGRAGSVAVPGWRW